MPSWLCRFLRATLGEAGHVRTWYLDGKWHIYSHDAGDFHVVSGAPLVREWDKNMRYIRTIPPASDVA